MRGKRLKIPTKAEPPKALRSPSPPMELAQENKFDLITLDVNLPDANGFEICSELKQRHISRHTPIIFISARQEKEDLQKGLELGAADYITKPFDPAGFVPRLLSHVKAPVAETANV